MYQDQLRPLKNYKQQQLQQKSDWFHVEMDDRMVVWFFYIRQMQELQHKYRRCGIQIRRDGVFINAPNDHVLDDLGHEIQSLTYNRFTFDYLSEGENDYAHYVDLVQNQEFEQIRIQYPGMCVLTKYKYLDLTKVMKRQFDFIDRTRLPEHFVLYFCERRDQVIIKEKLLRLSRSLKRLMDQNVTPCASRHFSAKGHDMVNRDQYRLEKVIQITFLDALWFFKKIDVRKLEEYHSVYVCVQVNKLRVYGRFEERLSEAQQYIITELAKKTMRLVDFEINYNFDLLKELQRKLDNTYEQVEIVSLKNLEKEANELDQQFQSNILQELTFLTKDIRQCIFVICLRQQLSEVMEYILKYLKQNQSHLTNSDINSEIIKKYSFTQQDQQRVNYDRYQVEYIEKSQLQQQQFKQQQPQQQQQQQQQQDIKQQQQVYIQKDNPQSITQFIQSDINQVINPQPKEYAKLQTLSVIKQYDVQSHQDGFRMQFYNDPSRRLIENKFDQADFEEYLRQEYSLPHEIVSDNNTFDIIYAHDGDIIEDKNLIVKMLEKYFNFDVTFVGEIDPDTISQQLNCSVKKIKTDHGEGYYEGVLVNDPKGSNVAYRFSNLLHSFRKQLRSLAEADYNSRIRSQISQKYIAVLTQEQINELAQKVKQLQLCQEYSFECYYASFDIQYLEDVKQTIITTSENQIKELIKVFGDKEVLEIDSKFKVFEEAYHRLYQEELLKELINFVPVQQGLQPVQKERRFYIEMTKQQVDPLFMWPLIQVIKQLEDVDFGYQLIGQLQPGTYCIGTTLNEARDKFPLKEAVMKITEIIVIR